MINTFFPRKSESRTTLPLRSVSAKSGAIADSKNGRRTRGIAPKLVVEAIIRAAVVDVGLMATTVSTARPKTIHY